jgi:predicted alpha/beta hydrolase family esterase
MSNADQSRSAPLLFIQGGGAGAHDEDARLVANLCSELGAGYEVRFPRMPNESESPYDLWSAVIASELARMGDGAILVGHSIGASVLIKWLTEVAPPHRLAAAFLIAAPFWHDHDIWRWKEVELPQDASVRLPRGLPVFFYHGTHDEVVPVAHVEMYERAFPAAHIRRINGRNHQLEDNLAEVARDIRLLAGDPCS